MTSPFYEAWAPLVERVAQYVARDFPEVEEEDLAQDLFLFAYERGADVDHPYAEKDLRAEAKKIAWKYKLAGTMVAPESAYRTADVMKKLDLIFSHEEDQLPPADPAKLTDNWVGDSDLQYAYNHLGTAFKRHIYERFALGIFPEDERAQERLYRAIVRMTDLLNMYRPRVDHQGPGARRVISNANGQSIIRGGYSE